MIYAMRRNLKNNELKNKQNTKPAPIRPQHKPQEIKKSQLPIQPPTPIITKEINNESTKEEILKVNNEPIKKEIPKVNNEPKINNIEPPERDPQDILKSQIKRELKSEIQSILKSQIKREIRQEMINEIKKEEPKETLKEEPKEDHKEGPKEESKEEPKEIPKEAEIKFYDNSEKEKNTAIVEWNIKSPEKYDRIALYQHDRMHDTNYIEVFNIDNKESGSYVFKNLVDGYYDVRLLNWKTRYENIEPVVCCIGNKVEFYVNIPEDKYPPVLNIYIPTKFIQNNNLSIYFLYQSGKFKSR